MVKRILPCVFETALNKKPLFFINSRYKFWCEGRWRRSTWAESETRNNCHRYIWYIDQLYPGCQSFFFCLILRNNKTGNKKRATCFVTFLQNELTSEVTRAFYEPRKKNLASVFVARQVWTCVVKRATLLFNSFSCNVAKKKKRALFVARSG